MKLKSFTGKSTSAAVLPSNLPSFGASLAASSRAAMQSMLRPRSISRFVSRSMLGGIRPVLLAEAQHALRSPLEDDGPLLLALVVRVHREHHLFSELKGILQNSGLPLLMLCILLGPAAASMLARRMATSVGDPTAFQVSSHCL